MDKLRPSFKRFTCYTWKIYSNSKAYLLWEQGMVLVSFLSSSYYVYQVALNKEVLDQTDFTLFHALF